MSKMKESTSRAAAAMQLSGVTSSTPRHPILTRSRSLASPLADMTLSLPGTNGATSSLAGAAVLGKGREPVDPPFSSSSATGQKKPLRRQRSLAEFFGAVLYKSKVQLQELFSRQDRDKDSSSLGRSSGQKAPSPTQFRKAAKGMSCSSRGATLDLGSDVCGERGLGRDVCGERGLGRDVCGERGLLSERSGSHGRGASGARARTSPHRKPAVASSPSSSPDPSFAVRGKSQTAASSMSPPAACSRPQARTPEELFCVTGQSSPSSASRRDSSVHRHHRDDLAHHKQQAERSDSSDYVCAASGGVGGGSISSSGGTFFKPSGSPKAAGSLLRPDRAPKAKTALVKSNSDSLCRLVLPEARGQGITLTKATSEDTCFARRTPSPVFLLPRHGGGKGGRSLLAGEGGGGGGGNDDNNNNDDDSESGGGSIHSNSSSRSASPMSSRVVEASCLSPILNWLLLGSVEAAYNEPLLCSLDVGGVVDITNVKPQSVPPEKKTTCPCTCSKRHFRSKLNLAVDDIEWENIEQHFADLNAFLNGWRQRGSRVLVVSYHGKSRGPAVIVQYLMHYYRISLQRALAHVRSCRPQTRINPGFMRALQRLEKRLADQDCAGGTGSIPPFPPPPQVPGHNSLRSLKKAWDEC